MPALLPVLAWPQEQPKRPGVEASSLRAWSPQEGRQPAPRGEEESGPWPVAGPESERLESPQPRLSALQPGQHPRCQTGHWYNLPGRALGRRRPPTTGLGIISPIRTSKSKFDQSKPSLSHDIRYKKYLHKFSKKSTGRKAVVRKLKDRQTFS